MHLAPLFRSSLLVVPLLFVMAACDTVGDAPIIDAAMSADAPASSSDVTITVTPSSPQAGEAVSLTLEVPSSYDMDGVTPIWRLESGESVGYGVSVEHVFDDAGEYGVSVTGLPDAVNVERVVSVVGEQ